MTAMDLAMKDRVYIVTGGTSGLGRATAEALVSEGARVVVSSRSQEHVSATVTDLGTDRAVGVAADNADETTPELLMGAARDTFGRLDGALISVGGPPPGPALATDVEAWRAGFESVFLGAVRLAVQTAEALSDGGALCLVLSTSVKQPIPGLATSNGLRPGLAMVAKNLADELGPRGIRVNGLLPGRLDTDRVRSLDAQSPDPEEAKRAHVGSIPLRRYGEPAEFGRVATFLLSPAAAYVTGVMLPVDGGLTRAL